ncbi:MAG: helix-turn-helix transcriptional regulator [Oscillospiraceae bacterium]|nr:helix-turn-helix transcriptional regulator [Oscillospiraceae bacterium]
MFQYDRFEALLKSRGITKTHISRCLGRSATLCQDWKQQKSQPSDKQLREVARILGTTPEYLRGETDEVSPGAMSEEMEQLLTSLREREDMRMLFKLAQDASPADVRQAVKIIEALRRDD